MTIGYIGTVKVQDILTNTWYTWTNPSGWDKEPAITPWGGLYIAAWIMNFSGSTKTITVSIWDSTRTYVEKTVTVADKQGFGTETFGTIGIAPEVHTFNVSAKPTDSGGYTFTFETQVLEPQAPTFECPVCGAKYFTQAQLDEHMASHPESMPGGKSGCMLTALGVPVVALSWLRVAVRPRLPFWFVRGYYRLGFWLLNKG